MAAAEKAALSASETVKGAEAVPTGGAGRSATSAPLPQPIAMTNSAASRGRIALRVAMAAGRVVATAHVFAVELSGGFFLEEGV